MDIELPAVRPNEETVVDEELPPSTVEYLNYRAIEQNGWDIEDEDLFEKAAEADLDKLNYGVMEVERGETLLRAAEDHGLKWPFQCRSATCAMCVGVLKNGSVRPSATTCRSCSTRFGCPTPKRLLRNAGKRGRLRRVFEACPQPL